MQCPPNSKPSANSAYCRCDEGYFYDHWTPGLHSDDSCKECAEKTLCRTLVKTEMNVVEGLGYHLSSPFQTLKPYSVSSYHIDFLWDIYEASASELDLL